MADRPRVLIVGGGYVGMYTALRLQRRLRPDEADITIVDPVGYMTYQPFLPEAAAGSLEPRHVVVPLRQVLRRVRVLTAPVVGIDHSRRCVRVQPEGGSAYDLEYDILVVALGSVSRVLPVPGLAEHGIGFKSIEEAIYLRNHVLRRIEIAASTDDPAKRRAALTFVFVGGGYAGIEAFAELEDMARAALKWTRGRLMPSDMRWVLVEASGRILPEVSESLAQYTLTQLRHRGMIVHLNTRVDSVSDAAVRLSDGTQYPAETLVWTAGVTPNPMLAASDLPTDEKGRLPCSPFLVVQGVDGVWAAGDCAAVPDLTQPGKMCGPSAQHAVRQARRLGDNLVAALRGDRLKPYWHAYAGSVASLGLYQGVAEVYGVTLRGFPAWFMHRTYHVTRLPTANRKSRVLADWTLALAFPREIVSLGGFASPRRAFEQLAAAEHAQHVQLPRQAQRSAAAAEVGGAA